MHPLKIIFLIIVLASSFSKAEASFFLSKKKTDHKWALFPYYFRSHILGHVASARVFIFPTKKTGLYWSLSSKWKISQGYKLSLNTRLIYTFLNQSQFSLDAEAGSFYDSVYAKDVKNPSLFFKGLNLSQSIEIPTQKTHIKASYLLPIFPSIVAGLFLDLKQREELSTSCFVIKDGERKKKLRCPNLAPKSNILSLGFHWKYDTRDNIFNPKKGMLYQGDLKTGYVLESKALFSTIEMNFNSIFSLIEKEKWWFNLALGFTPYKSQVLPYSHQFKLGGSDKLRGYHLARFHVDQYLMAQLELRVPMLEWLEGVLFSDVAVMDHLRKGFGVGVRVGIPPSYEQRLRLEWAYGEDQHNFVVSFSYPY